MATLATTRTYSRMRSGMLQALAVSLACYATGRAQSAPANPNATQPIPKPAIGQALPDGNAAAPGSLTPRVSTDIAKRPYTSALPAPLYPSTPRKQSQFTVQYIYNYAQSSYSPPVVLPLLSRGAGKHDTPESTLAAYYSAMRSGDYEGWLQCWDEPSRKALEARTKQQKNGAEYWRALWRQYFANKRFVLKDRLETVNYIILDTDIEDPAHPGAKQPDSEVLTSKLGQWYLTNEFTDDGLVMNFDPSAPTAKAVKQFEIAPISQLVGPATLSGQAQKDFFARHTVSSSLTRTME